MYEPNSLDKKNLFVQFENFKLIFEVNSDLMRVDPLLKEKISHRIGLLKNHLDDLEMWEMTDSQTKYDNLIAQANRIVEEIKVLIEQMLNQENSPPVDSLQNPAESLDSL